MPFHPSYPVSLHLTGRPCVVIGGRPFIARKVRALLACSAEVTVISPDPCDALIEMAMKGEIRLLQRSYCSGDLAGAFLALNADQEHAAPIRAEASERGTLLNTVEIAESDFLLPAVHRQGRLSIAVSTSGTFPALAVRLRDTLAQEFGEAYATWLEWLALLRHVVLVHVPDYTRRHPIWMALAASPAFARLESGDPEGAWNELRDLVVVHLSDMDVSALLPPDPPQKFPW